MVRNAPPIVIPFDGVEVFRAFEAPNDRDNEKYMILTV